MGMISGRDEGKNDWAVFKRAWEVSKYLEQAKTNLVANFSLERNTEMEQ